MEESDRGSVKQSGAGASLMNSSMGESDERELIARCRRGDEQAFQELVERYKDLVYAVIVRSVPDRTRADDLAQDAFLRVYRGLPYFRGEARLSTWIFRIVANLCAEARGRHRVPEQPLDDDRDDRPPLDPGATDRAFGDLELRDRLEKAIAQLPARYQVLIAGHYLQGIQYEDLAAALDLPLGTVKTQLHRARRHLRRVLEQA